MYGYGMQDDDLEVLERGYAHKHVTKLIYVASSLDGTCATDWDTCMQECERFRNAACAKGTLEDQSI